MGSATTEKYDITWNNFESRLSRPLAEIWSQGQFLDVTLAADAEDGSIEALRAHKGRYLYDVHTVFGFLEPPNQDNPLIRIWY